MTTEEILRYTSGAELTDLVNASSRLSTAMESDGDMVGAAREVVTCYAQLERHAEAFKRKVDEFKSIDGTPGVFTTSGGLRK